MKPRVHMYASHYDSTVVASASTSKNAGAGSGGGSGGGGSGGGTMLTTLELPGLRKADISITAKPNGELVVSGERRPQHFTYLAGLMDVDTETAMKDNGRTVFNELKFGRFQRIFKLPDGTDVCLVSSSNVMLKIGRLLMHCFSLL